MAECNILDAFRLTGSKSRLDKEIGLISLIGPILKFFAHLLSAFPKRFFSLDHFHCLWHSSNTQKSPSGALNMNQPDGFIDPHGGFRNLKSYQMAEIVYDATVKFCDRWIGRRSRTHDQMVQAARSGKQNIAEGSTASGTSKKTELKLVGVARASLEELLLDYQDFLRQRKLRLW
jgi:four helix bundle protein